jgi:hypothetical protein
MAALTSETVIVPALEIVYAAGLVELEVFQPLLPETAVRVARIEYDPAAGLVQVPEQDDKPDAQRLHVIVTPLTPVRVIAGLVVKAVLV